MRIAFIARSTLYKVPGGDTVQLLQTVKYLQQEGIDAAVFLTSDKIDYAAFDLLHFSNITRPSDILFHIAKTAKPFVLSPILIDYSEYDRLHRKGISGFILKRLPAVSTEYIKTLGRWLTSRDKLQSKAYLWKGQHKSIREILSRAAGLLPSSKEEYRKLQELYATKADHFIVPNGIDPSLFHPDEKVAKDEKLVVCAARIEGLKNQLNLIRSLNNTKYTLLLVGSFAPNQRKYYDACRKIAASNIFFHDHVPQDVLCSYYKTAKVHALPSWFETCGLSSLEAAAMGCNVVITEKGYTREYFGNEAFYCDPSDPRSIFEAIEAAAQQPVHKALQQRILQYYTWQQTAAITLHSCKNILSV